MTLSERLRSELRLPRALWTRLATLSAPKPRLQPDEWARENRVYPPSSGRPGKRDPGLTPYIIAFERFFSDDRYETCALVAGTQVSKTDGVLDVIGWRLDTRPRPQLYVGPSRDFVAEQFEPRLMKLLDEAASLKDLVARGKRNKKVRKIIAGVSVRLAWAGSETSLASDQAGDVYVDEYDKMGGGLKGTGDAFTLAKARADTYRDRKIAVTSTPKRGRVETEKCARGSGLEFWQVVDPADLESPIWVKWQSGTRHHFAWRCPHCAEWFIPRLRDLKAPEGATPAQARRGAYLCCPINGCVIEETHKAEMNRTGVFVAPGQIIRQDGSLDGDPPDSTMLSLWVSGLASPFVTWGERLEEIMLAELTGDDEAKQGAINKVGELYAPLVGEAPEWATVAALRMPYGKRDVPDQVVMVTAGVDVQKRRLYFVVRGWGARQESWLLDHGQLWGETGDVAGDVWLELAELLGQPLAGLPIRRAFIDSGFRPNKRDAGDEHRVYEFARRHARVVYACKGYASRSTPLTVNRIDVASRGGRPKYGLDLVRLDSDFFKSWVHERVHWPAGQPGGWHLFETADDDYCKQIVSEARERAPSGRVTWHRRSPANHFLDCFDPKTELLTESGWLPVADARAEIKFATVNLKTDQIEYQAALSVISRHHRGEMISIKGRRIDALVTPNHRMVTYRRSPVREDAHITLAGDLTVWHTIKLTGKWAGFDQGQFDLSGVLVDAADWAELLGWYVACGHRRARGKHKTSIFSHARGIDQDRLVTLVERLGFRWRRASDRQIVVTSAHLHAALSTCEVEGVERSSARKLVPEWIRRASPRIIARFVDAAMIADGSDQNGFRTFVTISKALADGMQELIFKLGRSPNVKLRQPPVMEIQGRVHPTAVQYHVSEAKTVAASLRRSDNTPIFRRVAYDGPVHCVSVANGTLVARRNGKLMIAGNCEALAYAAAYMLGVQRISDEAARAAIAQRAAIARAASSGEAPPIIARPRGRRVLSPGI